MERAPVGRHAASSVGDLRTTPRPCAWFLRRPAPESHGCCAWSRRRGRRRARAAVSLPAAGVRTSAALDEKCQPAQGQHTGHADWADRCAGTPGGGRRRRARRGAWPGGGGAGGRQQARQPRPKHWGSDHSRGRGGRRALSRVLRAAGARRLRVGRPTADLATDVVESITDAPLVVVTTHQAFATLTSLFVGDTWSVRTLARASVSSSVLTSTALRLADYWLGVERVQRQAAEGAD